MAVNDIFKFSVVGRFSNGQDWVNVHYYKQTSAFILVPPEQAIIDDWVANVETTFLTALSSNMVLDQYEVRGVFGSAASLDWPVGLPGTGGAGDFLPPMDAPLVSWRTGLIGRANRGRTYLPGAFESFQANGVLTLAAIAFYQGIADSIKTLYDPVTGLVPEFAKVIFHTNDTDSPVVTTALVRNQVATQRRRRT